LLAIPHEFLPQCFTLSRLDGFSCCCCASANSCSKRRSPPPPQLEAKQPERSPRGSTLSAGNDRCSRSDLCAPQARCAFCKQLQSTLGHSGRLSDAIIIISCRRRPSSSRHILLWRRIHPACLPACSFQHGHVVVLVDHVRIERALLGRAIQDTVWQYHW
jgi:hypothetical protein